MFRFTIDNMGDRIQRLPDGEVGDWDNWIRWQCPRIGQSPQMAVEANDNVYVPLWPWHNVAGVASAEEIEFPDLGHGDYTIRS